MAGRETLDLLLKLDVQGDAQLKGMASDADKAAQRLTELSQKADLATRTMATQQRELAGLQQQYAATAGKATELADKLDKVVAAEGKNSAAATKLQSELDRTATAAQKVAIAIEKKEIALQRGSNALQKIASEAGRTGQALTTEAAAATRAAQAHVSLTRDTATAGNAFTGMATKLSTLAAGYFGLQGIVQAVEWGKQGAAIVGVRDSFEKLAASAGTTGDALLSAMQKASKGTIADSELMAKANTAVLLTQGRLASELPRLLEVARASAKATGQSVTEAFDSLVLGLSRNSKMIIDNLGFTIDIAKANEVYAQSIGKTASALTDQEKAIAFQNAVLAQGDALVKTLGDSSLTTADKIAQAEANIKNFTDSLKVMAGEAVGFVAGGINAIPVILGGVGAAVNDLTVQALAAGRSWNEYKAAFDAVGEGGEAFTQQAWAAVLALQEQGVSAQDAVAQVAALKDTEGELADALVNVGLQSGMTGEAQAALIEKALELAAASPAAAEGVAVLIEQLDGGRGSLEEFTAGLEVIAINQEYAASTSFGYADAQLSAADASDVATDSAYAAADSVFYLSEEQAENANISAEAELAALNLADAHAMMEQVVANVQSGLYSESDALAILQAQFHLSETAALRFLNVQLALNAALGKQTSIANMGKLVNVGGKAYEKQVAEQQRAAERAGAAARREADRAARPARGARGGGSGGGGKGKKAGKSPEVKQAEADAKALDKAQEKLDDIVEKHLEKRAELEQDHADRVKAINDKANADRLAATQKLQDDQIQGRAGFYASLVGMDIADQQAAKARYEEHWRIRGELAAAGKQKEADAYMAAADEELQADLQRNAEIKAAREELNQAMMDGDSARVAQLQADIANLEYSDKLLDDAAAARLEKLKNANDSIAEEQQAALDKENQNFSEAGAKLKEDFDKAVADVSSGFGDISAAARAEADAIIAAAQAATAAVNAIPMPSASGAPAGEAPQGSYATGTGDRGLPRTGLFEGHAGEIILNRYQSSALVAAGGTRALDQGRIAAPLAGARTPGVSTAGSVSSTVTNAPSISVAVSVAGANATPAQITAAAKAGGVQALDEFNRRTGGSAASRKKLGY